MTKIEKILLSIFVPLEVIPILFYKSDLKVYFKSVDYEMWLCNFLHYISYYYILIVLFYFLWRKSSVYYKPFFIWRCLELIGFFVFASQKTNLITIPILLILLIYEQKKQKSTWN